MICRRYLEHQGFSSVPFWRLQAFVQKDGVLLQTTCAEDFATEEEAQTAFAALSLSVLLGSYLCQSQGRSNAPTFAL